ncbi:hypothetical protein RAS2_18380 [Phycisphaerae bacterium RAS2]|nr:hypothetical protein RAS2_18380 [Phycisphaerae bacterium RAS2]
MSRHTQQLFEWARESRENPRIPQPTTPEMPAPEHVQLEPDPKLEQLQAPDWSAVPCPKPLPEAVAEGVFGTTTEGPIEPDDEEIRGMTEEHGRELVAILADIQAVQDARRTGEDPRTGKQPRMPEAEIKLREFLDQEEPRLRSAYAAALEAYARGFGPQATAALDSWTRKTVADCTIEPKDRYDPGHPWHYLPEGDNAAPVPVDSIEPDIDVGKFLERELPKNPIKRKEKLRAMLEQEKQRVAHDKRRYQEIVELGAEALSRYDREIAHTTDEMARATALALKYNHLRYGLGRVAWLEVRLGVTS